MTAKKKATKAPVVDWLSDHPDHERTDAETLAHEIVTERPDLSVSLAKIMRSELDAAGQLKALTLFQAALGAPDDEHRDPMVAIRRCMPK